MNNTLTLIFMFCIVATLYIFFYPKIRLEVYNKTIHNIDSLKIDNHYYSIPKGKSIVIKCTKLSLQDDLPFGEPTGKIKGHKETSFKTILCGTGITEVRTGNYTFNIKAIVEKNAYQLYWAEH